MPITRTGTENVLRMREEVEPRLAAAESGTIRKMLFIEFCATRGESACSNSPTMLNRVSRKRGRGSSARAARRASERRPGRQGNGPSMLLKGIEVRAGPQK